MRFARRSQKRYEESFMRSSNLSIVISFNIIELRMFLVILLYSYIIIVNNYFGTADLGHKLLKYL